MELANSTCLSPSSKEAIVLSIDEYETIRLIDLEKMTQEQYTNLMGVSRTTVTRSMTVREENWRR